MNVQTGWMLRNLKKLLNNLSCSSYNEELVSWLGSVVEDGKGLEARIYKFYPKNWLGKEGKIRF